MSEYEAIIFLKNIVKQNGDLDAYTTVPFYKKEAKAIETILDLYQKQKEKNKGLLKQLEEKEKEVVLVPEGTCFMMKPKNVVSKDKIRAKIEKLKNTKYYKELLINDHPMTKNERIVFRQVDILEELLEEE